ncbi:MAG TPA: SxtJ family membrane protein [Pirellulales bacterium]|nr:SxtJ family membrane protein [Pirellulales bacterium]
MQWSDVNFHPTTKTLRQFAVLAMLFLLAIAGWQTFAHGRATLGMVLSVAALVIGTLGALSPASVRWLFVGMTLATFPIGWLMSWVLFGALYYLVFTPIALVFRLAGRDVLERRYNPTVDSYWSEKRPVDDVRRYFRQF